MAHCSQKIQCGDKDPNTGRLTFTCKCQEEVMSSAKQESMEEEWWE